MCDRNYCISSWVLFFRVTWFSPDITGCHWMFAVCTSYNLNRQLVKRKPFPEIPTHNKLKIHTASMKKSIIMVPWSHCFYPIHIFKFEFICFSFGVFYHGPFLLGWRTANKCLWHFYMKLIVGARAITLWNRFDLWTLDFICGVFSHQWHARSTFVMPVCRFTAFRARLLNLFRIYHNF